MNNKTYILEIAVSDFLTAEMALNAGADRIELCANLAEGGTTPSKGLIKKVRDKFVDAEIFPIIRPRGGDFLYSQDEFEIMLDDVLFAKQTGCNGVVIGMLNADGSIAVDKCSTLVNAAYPLEVTFHRAFDRCKEPMEALEQIIKMGCTRILTSGQQPTAIEGIELIKELQGATAERIIILPGSGIRKNNIKTIAEKVGCNEFHASLRSKVRSSMQFIHPHFVNSEESYFNNAISEQELGEMRVLLQ